MPSQADAFGQPPLVKDTQDGTAPPARPVPKRVSQRAILPYATKFRLIEFYDPTDNSVKFYTIAGTLFLTLNLTSGLVTFGENVTFEDDVTFTGIFDVSGVITNANNRYITAGTEFYRSVSFEHTFTGSASYLDNTGSSFQFDGADVAGFDTYYEATMAVETAGRTAYSQIYNVTDGVAVTGSEVTSSALGITGQSPDPARSGIITWPSGQKEYIIQRKQAPAGNGGDNMHHYLASLVFVKT